MGRKPRLATDGTQLLTPSQERLLGYIASETVRTGGVCATKLDLARTIGCGEKTIDRAVSCLKARGLLDVEMCFDEHGAQRPSVYRALGANSTQASTSPTERQN